MESSLRHDRYICISRDLANVRASLIDEFTQITCDEIHKDSLTLKLLTRTGYIGHFYMEMTLSIHFMPRNSILHATVPLQKWTQILTGDMGKGSRCPVSTGPFSNNFRPHGQGVEISPLN